MRCRRAPSGDCRGFASAPASGLKSTPCPVPRGAPGSLCRLQARVQAVQFRVYLCRLPPRVQAVQFRVYLCRLPARCRLCSSGFTCAGCRHVPLAALDGSSGKPWDALCAPMCPPSAARCQCPDQQAERKVAHRRHCMPYRRAGRPHLIRGCALHLLFPWQCGVLWEVALLFPGGSDALGRLQRLHCCSRWGPQCLCER
jgi:hypothetical protein